MSHIKIQTTDLTKIFGGAIEKKPVLALYKLNIEVNSGEVYAFLGPNGAGKTTTIKLLTRLIRPTKGTVCIDGVSTRNQQAMQKIGFLPEQPNLYGYLTGYEFLDFIGRLFKMNTIDRRKRIDFLIEKVGLKDRANRKIKGFSRGMTQRLAVAQALINNPDILILDEPLSNLDPIGRREIRNIILELKELKKTVFFSSHILSDAELVADRAAIINQGKLIQVGTLHELTGTEYTNIEVTFCLNKENQVKLKLHDVVFQDDLCMAQMKSQEETQVFIRKIFNLNGEIVSVVPRRKNLEDIFMTEIGR